MEWSTLATFLLSVAAFVSIYQTYKITRYNKDINDELRKDNFLPLLRIKSIRICPHGYSFEIGNSGRGVAIFTGFFVHPPSNKSKGHKLDGSGDMGNNIEIIPNESKTIELKIFIHEREFWSRDLDLYFMDIFGRHITLSCRVLYNFKKGIYYKSSYVRMTLAHSQEINHRLPFCFLFYFGIYKFMKILRKNK